MAIRVFTVSLAAWNRDELAAQIGTALGLSGVLAYGNATSISVSHPSITAANDAAINTVIAAYVMSPTFGVLPEKINLQNVISVLRNWKTDSVTDTGAAWVGTTYTAQKDAALKKWIQRIGTLVDRMADLLKVSDLGS